MGTASKRKQSKAFGFKVVLLGAFVFSVFSSTSFAKEVSALNQKSCGSVAKPVYFNSSGAGLKDMQMGLVDGEYGPEFQIGKTRIVFGTFDSTAQGSNNKSGSFGVIDAPQLREGVKKGEIDVQYFHDTKGTQEPKQVGNGKPQAQRKELKISENGEEATVTLYETKSADGKSTIDRFLIIKGREGKNSVRVDIDSKSTSKKSDVKMSVSAVPASDGCDLSDGGNSPGKPRISGIIETHAIGNKPQGGGGGSSDPNSGYKLTACKNTQTGSDYSKNPKNNEPQKTTVDLDGIDFVVGKNQAPNNQFQCNQRVPRDDKEKTGTPAPPIPQRAIAGNGRS